MSHPDTTHAPPNYGHGVYFHPQLVRQRFALIKTPSDDYELQVLYPVVRTHCSDHRYEERLRVPPAGINQIAMHMAGKDHLRYMRITPTNHTAVRNIPDRSFCEYCETGIKDPVEHMKKMHNCSLFRTTGVTDLKYVCENLIDTVFKPVRAHPTDAEVPAPGGGPVYNWLLKAKAEYNYLLENLNIQVDELIEGVESRQLAGDNEQTVCNNLLKKKNDTQSNLNRVLVLIEDSLHDNEPYEPQ